MVYFLSSGFFYNLVSHPVTKTTEGKTMRGNIAAAVVVAGFTMMFSGPLLVWKVADSSTEKLNLLAFTAFGFALVLLWSVLQILTFFQTPDNGKDS